MTPLPPPLGSGALTLWRIDDARFANDWNQGFGARQFGGRWNRVGTPAVYCSLDPSTAILEVAVHKGFRALDIVPHILTAATLADPVAIAVIQPHELPNAAWLDPRQPADVGPQRFGDTLLQRFGSFAIPSAVSRHSWNIVLLARADIGFSGVAQEPLIVDPRLHSPPDAR